ncbi:PQQ-dependent sugar dehydrogenase [Alteromonas lipolytica]|uniref:Glucose dehydrogenase n=1 Tax=Alteromonas lipolytica TaxID=1856405 RepID=A0A1E8FA70_9ALTE|nr:PQQ-dependent sugar dehydrogenase [Alteromonas lipolytica]OFI32423.1 glucose dehydrogenase [Alteromonas lipolytica]GGF79812.1 glucose sorbosone dehydrogenase [Alteromonas lipolytica]
MKRPHLPVAKLTALAIAGAVAFSSQAAEKLAVNELATGLDHPWGMTFLPSGEMLITERSGQIRRFNFATGLSKPLDGVPAVAAANQGGLLDITVDPDFANNQQIYFCYSRPTTGGSSSSVAKATLNANGLTDVKDIFVADSVVDNGFHFGCRLAFDQSNHLFVTLGDRYKYMKEAQNPANHYGKIVRIKSDGSVPADNPFADGKAPEVYSYGHRNVQGLTIHLQTGEVWAMEHGPKGGDEVNLIKAGNNYGWPVITYGIDYNGSIISDKTAQQGMEQPVLYWDPSIAPSGMTFYHGDLFKDWQGDLLVGALKFRHLRRISFNETGEVESQTEYLRDRNERIRDVEVGPNGMIYLLTDEDNGKLLQVMPAQ